MRPRALLLALVLLLAYGCAPKVEPVADAMLDSTSIIVDGLIAEREQRHREAELLLRALLRDADSLLIHGKHTDIGIHRVGRRQYRVTLYDRRYPSDVERMRTGS